MQGHGGGGEYLRVCRSRESERERRFIVSAPLCALALLSLPRSPLLRSAAVRLCLWGLSRELIARTGSKSTAGEIAHAREAMAVQQSTSGCVEKSPPHARWESAPSAAHSGISTVVVAAQPWLRTTQWRTLESCRCTAGWRSGPGGRSARQREEESGVQHSSAFHPPHHAPVLLCECAVREQ